MKKYTSLRKGFTLVELMIVIAIIGILAAVLYPSMTGYFERSRDTNRQAAMQQINLALTTYFTDRESYPGSDNTKCLKEVESELKGSNWSTVYVKNVPSDPQGKSTVASCQTAGSYSYEWIQNNTGGAKGSSFKAAARVESPGNGNMRINEYNNADTTGKMTESILTKAELTGSDTNKKATAENYAILTTTAQ